MVPSKEDDDGDPRSSDPNGCLCFLKHLFASFLSHTEAFCLIISNGWPMSNPASQSRNSVDAGGLATPRRSTQRTASSNQVEEQYPTPRATDEILNLVAPSSGAVKDAGTLEGPGDGERFAEGVPDAVKESSDISTASVSPLWELEDTDAPGMPEGYKTLVESEFAVDVDEFFRLFFSDHSIGFLKCFHTKRGDDEFWCTQWAKHPDLGHARDISFRHPINIYFAPKSTHCNETQRFRVYRDSHLVLETSQHLTDIPFGDYFRVEVRWDVERVPGKGSYHCVIRVSLNVNFLKKTIWKRQIEQGTHEKSKEAYTLWIREAQSILKETRALALAVDAGTPENTTTAPSSDTAGNIREMATLDDPVLAEVEQPLLRLRDVHSLLNTSFNKVEGSQCSRVKEGALCYQRWKKKGSALVETCVLILQKIWGKCYNTKFRSDKQQLQLVFFILVAIILMLMQVGILIALAGPQKGQYVGMGYSSNQIRSPRSCFSGWTWEEAFRSLEQKARHVKDEMVMAENRLQTLHQDLSVLKSHVGHLLSSVVDTHYNLIQTFTEE